MKYTNLIFDLGGVIINLAPEKTVQAFADLTQLPTERVMEIYKTRPEFHEYEKGLITDVDFRAALRDMFACHETDEKLDACWNAMLLDIPVARLELLERLRKKHQLFLLSNTNNIHLECFNKIVAGVSPHQRLDPYFDKAYYSHLMRMRKPDAEIYEYVLHAHALNPQETLFLDDNLMNLEGAQKVGIQTFHVAHPDVLFTLFSKINGVPTK